MRRENRLIPIAAKIVLLCFLQMTLFSAAGPIRAADCPYDADNPSLDNARISFRSLNYTCAEQEILDLLNKADLTIEDKADAHVLLAAVYYAKLKNDKDKRSRVIEQFKAAFQAYRDWRGDLDISSTEFFDMMQEAQAQVDQETKDNPPVVAEEPPTKETTPAPAEEESPVVQVETTQPEEEAAIAHMPAYESTEKASKPWYKKWWAIGLGVGLVAGAVVLAAGGGSDDGGSTDNTPLPDFPDPPAGKK